MTTTINDRFSYYLKPIRNIHPYGSVTLERIYRLISGGKLESVTRQVRSGERLKTKVLPYITPSGAFKERSMDHLISYSGIVGIDLDHIDTAIISTLFKDSFLHPALLFISPSNKGIKMFVRVTGAVSEKHDQYFNAISMYLFSAYRLYSDPACRDISRACFLCHHADALFSENGSVSSSALIDLIPGLSLIPITADGSVESVETRHCLVSGRHCLVSAASTPTGPKKTLPSTTLPILQHNDHTSFVCSKLNSSSAVYNYACSLLKLNGWSQKGSYWCRPGKEFKNGHSAVFTFYNPYGIYLFTNYTSSSVHFAINKSYTLCSLISILGYHSDFAWCIADLQSLFKNSV